MAVTIDGLKDRIYLVLSQVPQLSVELIGTIEQSRSFLTEGSI